MKKTTNRILIAIVVATVVLGAYAWYARMHLRSLNEMRDVQEICVVLMQYVESHKGQLPAGWDDLVAADLARPSPDSATALILREYDRSLGSGKDWWEVHDVSRYAISFGVGPEDLRIVGSNVLDADGRAVLLISRIGPGQCDQSWYHQWTLWLGQAMKASSAQNRASSAHTKRAVTPVDIAPLR